jgi:hypothetical protein
VATVLKEKKSSDWIELIAIVRKMNPLVLVLAVFFAVISGVIIRCEIELTKKAVLVGSGVFLQFIALGFEAFRIEREEKQRLKVLE